MRIGLDESVLHGFVGLCGIPQVMERDPRGAPLVTGDQFGVPLARFRVPALRLKALTADAAALSASRVGMPAA